MKFAYVDESGDREQSDVFVMAGLLIDAYRLRKHTIAFDAMIKEFLAKHPGAPTEIKTKALLNGAGGWSKVDAEDRKTFVSDIGDLAIGCTKIYPIAFSFQHFDKAMKGGHGHPFNTYGQATALFIASLVQQKMQDEDGNKGLTVLICDDNRMVMSALSDHLYIASPWFDPIYQRGVKEEGLSYPFARSSTRRAFRPHREHRLCDQVASLLVRPGRRCRLLGLPATSGATYRR